MALWLALACAPLSVGCAGAKHQEVRVAPPPPVAPPAAGPLGVTHTVAEGQTLWRIARVYGVPLDTLAGANGIDDPTLIEIGQKLQVPGAQAVLDVPPYPAPLGPGAARETPGGGFDWPVEQGHLLSRYGAKRGGHRHVGIDIAATLGQPVRAARGGEVVYSGSTLRGYGKTVIIDHGDALSTLYAHNSELVAREGDRVERGEVIARVGRTGNASVEHCHFEIRRGDVPVDPMPFLAASQP